MLALQLQGADEARGAAELVEGQQAQGVAHDDAHPGASEPVLARVAEPAQDHGEGGEAEVGLGLAAAGREEEQVDRLAVRVARVGEAGQVEQDEGELEGAPARRLDVGAAAAGLGLRPGWLRGRRRARRRRSARTAMPRSIRSAASCPRSGAALRRFRAACP